MAKKKEEKVIHYAPIVYQPITETIEKNYMPYVMSVIVSRAIPEIDGLKPAHRKLLYTMYKMGLLTGPRTKSANIVGQTMRLNPHGDASIYETMVRLTRGNATLLHPLVDSKGSFGKQYSSDMKYAAARYTECKLDPICTELFGGIDKNAVDMVDNYDATMKEPVLLPTTFPNILVMPNMGIAVGMASNICSFNLAEVCDGTIAMLRKPNLSVDKLMEIIKAPDFSGGGVILYEREQMKQIYETGQGSVRLRARYVFDKANNCIEIVQIPYSTTIELIQAKLTALYKEGKLKEVTDFRDEIDLNGFKLTLDIRRGVDPDKLMARLFRQTPLEDSFKCNFNVLIDSVPRTMGLCGILAEWIRFRLGCLRRELEFDLQKKKDKLHLLLALGKILLDIDKAIRIIRKTEKEEDVVPNLMKGFDIDEIQANYIADIKLRNLNREYILNRISDIEGLQKEIAEMEEILADELRQKAVIIGQLQEIKKKYGQARRSQIVTSWKQVTREELNEAENYNARFVLTREGYFKKITFQSLRGNDEQKCKDGDSILNMMDGENRDDLIFFTDHAQLYRAKADDFDTAKASALGEYLPVKLKMDPDEKPILMNVQNSYPAKENVIFLFENGKGVRVSMANYEITGNRRRITSAFSAKSPVVAAFYEKEPMEILLVGSDNRGIVIKSTLIPLMSTRTSGGVTLMSLKPGQTVVRATTDLSEFADGSKGFKKLKIPATGVPLK
ncbi:MAG: DNA topoisomerase (ATP-hydrolyzing) subunit A [Eubacteriales bacterium]|nr:DNA topoisomerase (ATP-hydrolyzing) subunit A [Eubacteriales bacterium]